ncbi:MAG: DUF3141 domain-containing protein [Desulfobacterales bacterium]
MYPTFAFAAAPWMMDAADFTVDALQRGVLFLDVLRKRGDIYLDHLKQGQPPVLAFDYEMVLDGRHLERPVNYAIVHILDRRGESEDRRSRRRNDPSDRRCTPSPEPAEKQTGHRRPIVVIDPRAGHGPGIGGAKLDSQIGVALDWGHPVYFVLFFTEPEPGQTIADVQEAEVRFLEEVARRHPEAPKPAVIGNCQAGWAAALIGADRPDVTGPMVFNGSPLSYWGGVEGAYPMRYRGGLLGGVWIASFLSDLGNGSFDGAHLVAGFEDLNPANTWWSKLYHVYANVDTEEKRFLDFEKWWGGFFKMTAGEIHFILDSLFIGNELEQGAVELREGRWIRLKDFKDPIVVFASTGDNITPPPQALNWIVKVYGTEEAIKECGQVIVYLIHESVGHLGIFVSGSVARREHREIIGSMEMIEYLPPGLYEMVIDEGPSLPWLNDHRVRFESRTFADLMRLDDGLADEKAFETVRRISKANDLWYRTFVSPWVRLAINGMAAEGIRQLHPLRMQRYFLSSLNPAMAPVSRAAEAVRQVRRPADPDNPFLKLQEAASASIKAALDFGRDVRDLTLELTFRSFFDHPWIHPFFAASSPLPLELEEMQALAEPAGPRPPSHSESTESAFAEAVIRVLLAVAGANQSIDRRQFEASEKYFRRHPRLRLLKPDRIKEIIRHQAQLVAQDPSAALAGLVDLLPERGDRLEALRMAESIATADHELDLLEKDILTKIRRILDTPEEQGGSGAESPVEDLPAQ